MQNTSSLPRGRLSYDEQKLVLTHKQGPEEDGDAKGDPGKGGHPFHLLGVQELLQHWDHEHPDRTRCPAQGQTQDENGGAQVHQGEEEKNASVQEALQGQYLRLQI